MKIGMYTEDEIFEYMTDCEGSMLGRSMYDAIFDKIHALITENEQLKKDKKFYADAFVNLRNRNDKAIEYIMTELITEWDIKNGGHVSGSDLPVDAITPLLEILKGEGKDE